MNQFFYLIALMLIIKCVISDNFISHTKVLDDVKKGFKLSSFTNIASNNRYLDLVFTGSDQKSIHLRSYVEKNFTYTEPDGYQFTDFVHNTNLTDYRIIGLVPADFDGDKSTDLMVVFAHYKKENTYKYTILLNKNLKFSSPIYIDNDFSDIPHLIDYNGDLLVDFISAEGNVRGFYINQEDATGNFKKIDITEKSEINLGKGEMSYVYADLNGDCASDLFMVTKLANKSSVFQYYEAIDKALVFMYQVHIPELAIADQYSSPLAVDMDGNGKLDIVIAGCSNPSKDGQCLVSKIFTFYNDPGVMVGTACEGYDFVMQPNQLTVFDKFENKKKERYGFLHYNNADIYSSKIVLRAVDFDSDGHMDLITILKYDKSQQVVFLQNVEDSAVPNGRTYRPEWRDDVLINSPASSIYEPYAITAVDAMGIGNPQFFLIGRGIEDRNSFSFNLLVNKKVLDSFWFKITVLCEKCEDTSTTMIGATGFYSTTGVKGEPEVGYGTQNSQLTVNSLQAPYLLFGLGEQANYIEFLKVAYRKTGFSNETLEKDIQVQKFDLIIPNAQVFAIPKGSGDWKLAMMVVPGKLMWETLIVLGACCFICLVIILILHIKEKREDAREKIKFNTKFNFDAM